MKHMVLDLSNKNTLILAKNSASHLMFTSSVIVKLMGKIMQHLSIFM